ncbi:DUF413 domain-containing protein [Phocoenobacter skyensis]|uniref:Macrodomain Ori protein n=1 Tax=Phocoenobacter skyensis TaxID=97481 RepID=A0A1H7XSH2_9PAST|nr:DUF413 domain-containing protein [Pasteurella skyensis]MDP8078430.1 DUF413 domain-containing protein [Pasteurella skyensis]MDP8084478.1 DUF413 domain-containing protein [Pasteurella skyensis]MDP8161842.1 DUF413 domain-containing protein [Pasteurella skyensis]MDP8170467.1 DUF413 domain-containing protein [Pasteurella skyensis]MDP8171998.1 DUF413 domain-containing protein [Pasteurella skyensis]
MAESFKVTRRFFDDKNYPRGFSRQGDYTIFESQLLEQFGQACLALELGEREAKTTEEKQFVSVIKKEREAETPLEKVWIKYRTKINLSKRLYTLADNLGSDTEDLSD